MGKKILHIVSVPVIAFFVWWTAYLWYYQYHHSHKYSPCIGMDGVGGGGFGCIPETSKKYPFEAPLLATLMFLAIIGVIVGINYAVIRKHRPISSEDISETNGLASQFT